MDVSFGGWVTEQGGSAPPSPAGHKRLSTRFSVGDEVVSPGLGPRALSSPGSAMSLRKREPHLHDQSMRISNKWAGHEQSLQQQLERQLQIRAELLESLEQVRGSFDLQRAKKMDALLQEAAELEAQVAEQEQELEQLRGEVDAQEGEAARCREDAAQAEAERSETRQEMRELEECCSRLRERDIAALARYNAMQDELRRVPSADRDNAMLRQQREQLALEVAEWEERVGTLRGAIAAGPGTAAVHAALADAERGILCTVPRRQYEDLQTVVSAYRVLLHCTGRGGSSSPASPHSPHVLLPDAPVLAPPGSGRQRSSSPLRGDACAAAAAPPPSRGTPQPSRPAAEPARCAAAAPAGLPRPAAPPAVSPRLSAADLRSALPHLTDTLRRQSSMPGRRTASIGSAPSGGQRGGQLPAALARELRMVQFEDLGAVLTGEGTPLSRYCLRIEPGRAATLFCKQPPPGPAPPHVEIPWGELGAIDSRGSTGITLAHRGGAVALVCSDAAQSRAVLCMFRALGARTGEGDAAVSAAALRQATILQFDGLSVALSDAPADPAGRVRLEPNFIVFFAGQRESAVKWTTLISIGPVGQATASLSVAFSAAAGVRCTVECRTQAQLRALVACLVLFRERLPIAPELRRLVGAG
eukprot:TRINITY_DN6054_c0_g1_i1.p1 TRINITY_DN6054_c0_g1~~TRINITY_DN6054_c0_g1_i1.p1  ORF type:complete len:673 (+),score=204.06 TRINITY_DN6054_c0_g1_i1:88-2019(+)